MLRWMSSSTIRQCFSSRNCGFEVPTSRYHAALAAACSMPFGARGLNAGWVQVDFLPSKALTPEELQKQRELMEAMAKNTRTITTLVDGKPEAIEVFIKRAFKTNGGYMFDLAITYEEKETQHRVIVGKDYYEDYGIEPEQVLDRVFAFLLRKRVPRRTEGVLLALCCPVLHGLPFKHAHLVRA